VRRKNGRKWIDVSGDKIDPSRAYVVNLPSKKTISVFFYDGPISQAVAFEGLLNDGQRFADRLMGGFSDARTWPQLAHIATDGESYGHHHRHGEMALTYALHDIQEKKLAELTNYGQFLEKFPADHIVEIVPDSSWSCAHGVERWRSNCGCNSGGHSEWNQEWRAPLRAALDWLRDTLAAIFEEQAPAVLKEPWKARDEYIQVILDRSDVSLASFFSAHGTGSNDDAAQVRALKLLEMQRHALLMYTSCGWFFDEISGVETVQVIQYAGRALRLAQECTGKELEAEFLAHLKLAKSNLPEHGDGAQIYEKWVRPAYIDIERVAGHFAISSLFENYEDKSTIYCYSVDRTKSSLEADGKLRLGVGQARFSSKITRESADFDFAVVHLGEHNVIAGVRPSKPDDYDAFRKNLSEVFFRADIAEIIHVFDDTFGTRIFSLRSLFRDEQRKVTNLILADSLSSAAAAYRSIYDTQAPLIRFLYDLSIPVPPALKAAAQIVLNNQLRLEFEKTELDTGSVQGFLRESLASHIDIDVTTLEFTIRKRLEKEAEQIAEHLEEIEQVRKFRQFIDLILSLPFQIDMWTAQNILYNPLRQMLKGNPAEDNAAAQTPLRDELRELSERVKIASL
jgi:hypothetical protein